MTSILIVDDDKSVLRGLRLTLQPEYRVDTVENGSEAMRRVGREIPDLVLLDVGLPDIDGLEVLKEVKNTDPRIQVVMVTAVDEARTIVKALKLGAYDYLVKPLDGQEVKVTVRNALESKRLKDQIRRIQQPDVDKYSSGLVGNSPRLMSVKEIGKKVADSVETPVLIVGESGTGKGLLARAIHYSYGDLPGPFVTVNCTAITHELFESELFGYERGAFTGARSEGRKGRFEEAEDGTLFLDEIGSMSPAAQAKLLGVLEDRAFYRVGGSRPLKVSARIIAATNMDLEQAAEEGRFRRDLFFRLNVVKIEMPPLRERRDDIEPLTEYFMNHYSQKLGKRFTKISPDAKKVLLAYDWPGNVRELRNTIERILLLETGDVLLPGHLPFSHSRRKTEKIPATDFSSGHLDYEKTTKALLEEALKRSQGNVLEAARLLNMAPHKMRYRIKKYGLK
jgi:DNA-binding NtrC family response regulator